MLLPDMQAFGSDSAVQAISLRMAYLSTSMAMVALT